MVWSLSTLANLQIIHVLVFLGSILASLAITYATRAFAPKFGLVCIPKNDRWSRKVIPLGGGIGLYLVVAPFLYFVSLDLLIAASAIFILGLVDDFKNLNAATKLVVQTIAACWLVSSPLTSDMTTFKALGFFPVMLEILSLILIANSFNLLDNVDGSAAGVCAISLGVVAILGLNSDSGVSSAITFAAISLCGACIGFLKHNFPPARIFMGDAGSLFLGFTLCALYFKLPPISKNASVNFMVLLFVVGTSLFDTALVWFARWSIHRPFLKGGKDHVAHRLIALGLSESKTLLVIYGVTAALGGIALGIARGNVAFSGILGVIAGSTMIFMGLFLGEVPVYIKEKELNRRRPFKQFMYFGVEMMIDVLMIASAWILAWYFRFDDPLLSVYLASSGIVVLPLVIAVKVGCNFAFKLYRGVWRTIQFADFFWIGCATASSSLILFFIFSNFSIIEFYPRGVLTIDAMLTLLFVSANRSALRLFRNVASKLVNKPQRAILVGSSEFQPLLNANKEYKRMYTLVGIVAPSATPEEVIDKLSLWSPDIALIADPNEDQSAYIGVLKELGVGMRHLSVNLE